MRINDFSILLKFLIVCALVSLGCKQSNNAAPSVVAPPLEQERTEEGNQNPSIVIDRAWKATGIGENELKKILSDEVCLATEKEFVSCLSSANEAFKFLDSHLELAPKKYWHHGFDKVKSIISNFGAVQLVQIEVKDKKPEGSVKAVIAALNYERKTYSQEAKNLFASYRNKSIVRVRFSELADELLKFSKKMRGRGNELYVFNAFYSKYLTNFDAFSYLIPRAVLNWKGSQTKSTGNLNEVQMIYVDNTLLVKKVTPMSVFAKLGIRQGDRVIKINGSDIRKLNFKKILEVNNGVGRSEMKYDVLSAAGQMKTIVIDQTIEVVPKGNVVAEDLDYFGTTLRRIELRTFESGQVCNLVASYLFYPGSSHSKDIDGVILDLRGNQGGLLSMADCVASLFLEEGKVISKMRKMHSGEEETSYSKGFGPEFKTSKPLVVLVDGNSASASEYLAMALRDHSRAVIVGQPTYGKGSVSYPYEWPLQKDIILYQTGGVFYGPRGLTNNLVGIMPDFVVPWRTGAKPEEDFYPRIYDKSSLLTKPENGTVQPFDKFRNEQISKCINHKAILAREKLDFGTETGSDLPYYWAAEILRCQATAASK